MGASAKPPPTSLSKADYLQKYLSGGAGDGDSGSTTKKRRKKKRTDGGAKVAKIKSTTTLVVDDDGMGPNVWGKRRGVDEDAPIDEDKLALLEANTEAGPSVVVMEAAGGVGQAATATSEYDSSNWKAVGFTHVDGDGDEDRPRSKRQRHDSDSEDDGGEGGGRGTRARARHDSDSDSDLELSRRTTTEAAGRQRADSDSDSDLDVRRKPAHDDSDSDGDLDVARRPKPRGGDDEHGATDAVVVKKAAAGEKMSDGSRAGLRTGKLIKDDAAAAKLERAAELKRLANDESGRTASTVYRDKKTGKMVSVKDLVANKKREEEEKLLEKERQAETNRGSVQRHTSLQKAQEIAHEMSKPMARHSDDVDMNSHLKNTEHDNDPMMKFFAEKRKKERKKKGIKEKPTYKGDFPPNRFNIRPGYRWNGHVRTNGFEDKYLLTHNSRLASYNEYYKWSIEGQ